MVAERQILEAVARCVSTVVLYHNTGRTRKTAELMEAEVRAVVAAVSGNALRDCQAKRRVVAAVEGELQSRYGPEAGRELYKEFTRAFEELDGPLPVRGPGASV